MKLSMTQTATIYSFESDDGQTQYRFECIDGLVTRVERCTVEYFDTGDAEHGPRVGSELSTPVDLEMSRLWTESDLERHIDEIVKDAEEYTLYCISCSEDCPPLG